MPPLHGLDAVKTLLLRRGVHPDYVTRLLNELIDHRHDLIEDLVSSGVEAQIAGWRDQDTRFHPLAMLVDLQRLPLRAPRLQVVAMPFHPSGSGNYSPAAIYSSLFDKPTIATVLAEQLRHDG